jgi:hypothetical protein
MKKWIGILLALALPAAGASAQANEVVTLPTVAPLQAVEVSSATDYTTAPLREYYAWEGGEPVDEQAPRMSAQERERARQLLVAYQSGKRPAQDVLDKLDNVVVGVYTLKPEDYSGETLFTLLPVGPLTDEQILEVIDAFARSGQTFDPEALSYRNCMRGGGIEATRFYQADERDRRGILRDLYIRQGLAAKAVYTPLVSDDGLGMATLDPDSYSGLDVFLFLPHRQMTDDELLSYLIYREGGDSTEYGNYAGYEKTLRAELTRVVGAPLVLTRIYESIGRMGDFDVSYDDERVYTVSFEAIDGTSYWGALDVDTGKLLRANVWQESGLLYSDLHLDPFDAKWAAIAKETVLAARGDGAAVASAESCGECYLSEAGYGVLVNVVMEDGGQYTVQIAYQNESVYSGLSYQSHAPNLERMYPDEMFEK